jgi:TonB-linked SusC/RagA family outer membrane protein
MLMFCGTLAFGQDRVVSGKVLDEKDAPIPFATVTQAGSKATTVADASGNYTIKMTGTGDLTVSAAGYNAITIKPNGNNGDVMLKRGEGALQEVVVTSLGIQRQRKDLGYSTAKVTNEMLTQSSPVKVANGLQGKVSGLNVTSVNSGVFEDVKINLRGIRSLTGDNNPMLLLDGVQTPLAFLNQLNPNDIQDVNIIKGSSGAAIYGPDARNGAIIVTTKKGGSRGNPVITLSQTIQSSSISFYPEFQTGWGSGGGGIYTPYENWSWGPAFDGTQMPLGSELNNGDQQYVTYSPTNARKEFFNSAFTSQTDLSFGVKDFYISFQNVLVNGIVPEDENRRTGIRLNSERTYGKFKVAAGLNYIQQNFNVFDDDAMSDYNTANNVGLNGGLLNLIFNTPAQVPLTSYSDIKNNPYATYSNYFNHYGINPYTAIDNWRRLGKMDNFIGNVDFSFKASNSLSFTWRLAANTQNLNYQRTSRGQVPEPNPPNTNTLIPGGVTEGNERYSRLSSEVFANWNHTYGDFKFNAIVGQYVRQNTTNISTVGATNLVVPDLFNVSNGVGGTSGGNSYAETRTLSVYGLVGISYKGWANVEVTGRNDWASVLSAQNNSFFYPGVNASLVLSDAIPGMRGGHTVSYLKLRGGWNKTANAEIAPYSLQSTFSGTAQGFPYSVPGYTANNGAFDPNLKPEFIENAEIGLEVSFLKNRISVEVAAYTQDNTDQIIGVNVSSATGYTNATLNAASFVNKGIEFDLKLNPLVDFGAVKLNFRGNASYNTSEIKTIYPGLDKIFIGGYTTAANYADVGQPAFVFYATDYNRDSLGRVIVDGTTGIPTVNPVPTRFGRTMPVWLVGLIPSISYKNLTLTVVGEYKGGHMAYANIGSAMAWTGVSAATGQNYRERYVFPNSSIDDGSGKYIANTNVTIEDFGNFYTAEYRSAQTNFLTSADSWRIREVSLGFDFPASMFAHQKVIKGLNVALNARNLVLWLPKSNQFTDPDFNFTTGNTSGISDSQINPPTRTVGINVTAIF